MIDTTVPDSPGWWMQRCAVKLRSRLPRLIHLAAYHEGNPPLPVVDGQMTEVFRRFQQQSCTNFSELIVGSVRERVSVRDIRTAASGGQTDNVAWRLWRDNGLDVEFSDVLENMLALGDAYMIVGTDDDGVVITGEDPRQVVTIHDPVRQSRVRAAIKMFRDADAGEDFIVLWLPAAEPGGYARKFVARRLVGRGTGTSFYRPSTVFSPAAFDWDVEQGGSDGIELEHPYVPVVRFRNRRGVGAFEPHIALLNRINHMIYTRMVIALYQAFRQRAIQVDVDEDAVDAEGNPVDAIPDDLLTSDPGSWIQLPQNAKIWESQQADMQGIISSIDADVKQLAAVTRRPMSIFAPDNQSAQGARVGNEGLIFATEDAQNRAGQGLVEVMYLAFLASGDAVRADKASIAVGWNQIERYSLAERGETTAKAKGTLPDRTIWREVWQATPPQIDQIEAEAADQALLAQELQPLPIPAPTEVVKSGNPA